MLGGHDYLSDFASAPKTKILSAFINEETKQIDSKSLVKFAQTSKTNLITVSEVLSHFLLTSTASHPNPFLQARENISNFIKHPEYRKPEWLLSDRIGKNYVYDEVIAGRFNDPVSKILLGEVTPEQQTILNRIAEILTNPASVFTSLQREVLESRYIQAYIASGQLTIQQVLGICRDAMEAFKNEHVRAYIASNQLTIQQVLGISWHAMEAFKNEHVRAYIASNQLTMQQVLGISWHAMEAFKNEHVRAYIASNQLTIQQVLGSSWEAKEAFNNEHVRAYIASNQLTIQQVLGIGWEAKEAFNNEQIRARFTRGELTPAQVLGISWQAKEAFNNEHVRAYIASNQLTIQQVLGISWHAMEAFKNEHVRAYIASNQLTIQQVLGSSWEAKEAFNNEQIRARFTRGELTPAQVLNGVTVPERIVIDAAPVEVLSGGGGSGSANYHSLSTPLLDAASSERIRLEVARDPTESKCCESSCSIQ